MTTLPIQGHACRPLRWTPELGEHNRAVFCGLLAMDDIDLAALPEARIIW